MQIHELNTFSGTLNDSVYLAVDNGADTTKIPATEFAEAVDNAKVNLPTDIYDQPTYGTTGQVLRTKGDGETEWANVGQPTDEQTAQAVSDWLDEHPEATTTVQDGSITENKLNSSLLKKIQGLFLNQNRYDEYDIPSLTGASDVYGVQCITFDTYRDRLVIGFKNYNDRYDSALVALDVSSMSVVARTTGLSLGHCNDIAYNPDTDKLYVASFVGEGSPDQSYKRISVVNANNLTIDSTINTDFIVTNISYDETNKLYYVGDYVTLHVYDANWDEITSWEYGKYSSFGEIIGIKDDEVLDGQGSFVVDGRFYYIMWHRSANRAGDGAYPTFGNYIVSYDPSNNHNIDGYLYIEPVDDLDEVEGVVVNGTQAFMVGNRSGVYSPCLMTFRQCIYADHAIVPVSGSISWISEKIKTNVYSFTDYVEMSTNDDLNDYVAVGNYSCGSASKANTLSHCPASTAFVMRVYSSNGTWRPESSYRYAIQEIIDIGGKKYRRQFRYENGTYSYGSWITDEDVVLNVTWNGTSANPAVIQKGVVISIDGTLSLSSAVTAYTTVIASGFPSISRNFFAPASNGTIYQFYLSQGELHCRNGIPSGTNLYLGVLVKA